MLEWLESWLTGCPKWLRELGYLRESVAVRNTRAQCWFAWEPHLKRTRATILEAIEKCASQRKAILFGAGMLHDVPLAELAGSFREVVLVDILPTHETRKQARRLGNVHVQAADVTGTIEAVHAAAQRAGSKLPVSAPERFLDDDEVDLVASVNLLSQLPYLPVQYLKRRGNHDADAIDAYAHGVVTAHLDYLASFACPVVLVADWLKQTIDRAGRVLATETTVHGVELWPGEDWDWQLAPVMQLHREFGYRLRVRGAIRAAP